MSIISTDSVSSSFWSVAELSSVVSEFSGLSDGDGSSESTGLSDGDGSVDGDGSSDALGSFVGSADTDGSSEAPDSSDGLSAEVKFSEFSSPQKNNAVGFSYCFGI